MFPDPKHGPSAGDEQSISLPITIAVALIGLVFAWAFVRAVRRDLLPPTAA